MARNVVIQGIKHSDSHTYCTTQNVFGSSDLLGWSVSLHNYGQPAEREETALTQSEMMISQNCRTPNDSGGERQERVRDTTTDRRRRSDSSLRCQKMRPSEIK